MSQKNLRTDVWDAAFAAIRTHGMAEPVARKLADNVLDNFTKARLTTSKSNSVSPDTKAAIRKMLMDGKLSIHAIAKAAGTGVSTVQRVKGEVEHSTGRKVGAAAVSAASA